MEAPQIHAAISAIMGEIGGVAKTRKNEQQGYKFRGIADITLACQPLMAKHGVHVSPHSVVSEQVTERTTSKGNLMLHIRQQIEFRFYHRDGSFIQCVTTGEAMDSGDKTSNKVMSAALKYALTQTFCIPEDDPDADTESASPEIKATPKPKAAAKGSQHPDDFAFDKLATDAGKVLDKLEPIEVRAEAFWKEILARTGGDLDTAHQVLRDITSYPAKEGKYKAFEGVRSWGDLDTDKRLSIAKEKLAKHPVFGEAQTLLGREPGSDDDRPGLLS